MIQPWIKSPIRVACAFLRLLADRSGQITLSLALMVLPVCLTIGSALDYGILLKARSSLQQALDSATLAAAAKDGTLNEDTARSYFTLNGSLSGVKVAAISFSKSADGKVIGTARATVPAIFMKIMRQNDYGVNLTSTASGTPEMKRKDILSVQYVKGIYDIEFYQYSEDQSGKLSNQMLFITYDYTYDPVTRKATATLTRNPNFVSTTVPKGDTGGLMLIVYLDTSGRGHRINPDILKPTAPDSSNFLKAEGDCWTSRKIQYWEETRNPAGDYDAITGISCGMVKSGRMNVKLTE